MVISTTLQEGIDRLRAVFDRIRLASLKLKAEKCDLFKEEITYLGHVISKDGVKTDPKKVAAVQECAIPLFVTDVEVSWECAHTTENLLKIFPISPSH